MKPISFKDEHADGRPNRRLLDRAHDEGQNGQTITLNITVSGVLSHKQSKEQ